MNQAKKILIVEDEKRLAEILKAGLEEQGFIVQLAFDGYIGKKMVHKSQFDLIIIDINLPLINGYELCKEIRSGNDQTPILMLTAMGASENKLAGFDAGADDYIVKPFDFNELLARIKVFLRRSVSDTVQENIIRISDLEINLNKKTVHRNSIPIQLTAREYNLLEFLARNKGIVFSRAELAEKIWDINFDTGTNVIDVYINYLRKKVDRDFTIKLIHTRIGMGYVLKIENS
mgnify:CR=1 FL=1